VQEQGSLCRKAFNLCDTYKSAAYGLKKRTVKPTSFRFGLPSKYHIAVVVTSWRSDWFFVSRMSQYVCPGPSWIVSAEKNKRYALPRHKRVNELQARES
jgi:hypothetical protein